MPKASYIHSTGRTTPHTGAGWRKFSIAVEGYTFEFAQNLPDWQAAIRREGVAFFDGVREYLRTMIRLVAEEAIARCPHYSGALGRSIKVTLPSAVDIQRNGRGTAAVGVLSSWRSPYDDVVTLLATKTGLTYAVSGSDLAIMLHSRYDDIVNPLDTPHAWKRKTRKEAMNGGKRVGSEFLTRAWSENSQQVRSLASQAFIQGVRTKNISAEGADAINSALDQYASRFDGVSDD